MGPADQHQLFAFGGMPSDFDLTRAIHARLPGDTGEALEDFEGGGCGAWLDSWLSGSGLTATRDDGCPQRQISQPEIITRRQGQFDHRAHRNGFARRGSTERDNRWPIGGDGQRKTRFAGQSDAILICGGQRQ